MHRSQTGPPGDTTSLQSPITFSLSQGHLDGHQDPALDLRLLLTSFSTMRLRRPMEAQNSCFSLAGLWPAGGAGLGVGVLVC